MSRIVVAMVLLAMILGQSDVAKAYDDSRTYDVGQVVNVNINWQTFVDQDLDDYFTYEEFRDAFINAYTRWQQVGGAKVKFRWIGQTTRNPDERDEFQEGELFVKASKSHTTRIASAFGCDGLPRCAQIVVHRETSDGTRNVFNLWDGAVAGVDIEGVMMHEIGHTLGMWEHSTVEGTTMYVPYDFPNRRFGPFVEDRDRLIAMYGEENRVAAKMWRSTDEGLSYAAFGSLPTSLHTTGDVDGTRDSSTLIMAYTKQTKHPCWIMGTTAGTFDTSKWWCIGGQGSWYGASVDGEDGEYMIAWARPTTDGLNMDVRVAYGTTEQFETGSLTGRSPSGARTYGTPAIAKLGSNTWVLSYSRHTRTDDASIGEVVARVTTNDGASWSAEVVLNDFYRAASGVSIAGQQTGNVRIGFTYAADLNSVRGNYAHRVFRASLSGSTLSYQGVMTAGSDVTRTQPALARALNFYHLALRGPDAATSLYGSRATLAGTSWTDRIVSMAGTNDMYSTPGLAADKNGSNVYLFTPIL